MKRGLPAVFCKDFCASMYRQGVQLFPISKVPADSRFFRSLFPKIPEILFANSNIYIYIYLDPPPKIFSLRGIFCKLLNFKKMGFVFFPWKKKGENGLHIFCFVKWFHWMEIPGFSFFLRKSPLFPGSFNFPAICRFFFLRGHSISRLIPGFPSFSGFRGC